MEPVSKQSGLAVLGLCVEYELSKDTKFVILVETPNELANKVLQDPIGSDLFVLDLFVRCLRLAVLFPASVSAC